MTEVTQTEYDNYITSLQGAIVDNYNLCGEEKIYHKVNDEIVAIKTINEENIVYEISQ